MTIGHFTAVTATMASGESLTGSVQIGKARTTVYALIPSFSTNSVLEVWGSADGTTFNRVMHPPINSSTVSTNAYLIATGVTGWVGPLPADFPYIKLHATAAVAGGATFTFVFKG